MLRKGWQCPFAVHIHCPGFSLLLLLHACLPSVLPSFLSLAVEWENKRCFLFFFYLSPGRNGETQTYHEALKRWSLEKEGENIFFFFSYQKGLFVVIGLTSVLIRYLLSTWLATFWTAFVYLIVKGQAVFDGWLKSIVFKVCSKEFHMSLNQLWGSLKKQPSKEWML